MAEPTTTATYDELRRLVGNRLGYGRDPSAWTSGNLYKATDVDDVIRRAYNRVVEAHDWSFLKPASLTITLQAPYATGTVTIVAGVVTLSGGTFPSWAASGELIVGGRTYTVNTRDGNTQVTLDDTSVAADAGTTYSLVQSTYDLPDDFGGFHGPLTPPPGSGYPVVTTVDDGLIAFARAPLDYTGYVTNIGYRPKTKTTSASTRWEAVTYPISSVATTLKGRYRVSVDMFIASTSIYPHGGAKIGELLRAACEAATDRVDGVRGDAEDYFQRILADAIARDSEMSAPERLGGDLPLEGCQIDEISDHRRRFAPDLSGTANYEF